MKDLACVTALLASVAWLIPYPGWIWLSGVVWVVVWFATPTDVTSPKGRRSQRSGMGSSDSR